MAKYETKTVKIVCDRCGNSLEGSSLPTPSDWQTLMIGNTGAELDLCPDCNDELLDYLKEKNADYMELATHAKKVVL